MSLLAFVGVGVFCVFVMRPLLPRTRTLAPSTALIAAVLGSLSAGLVTAAVAREGLWHQIFPTSLLFAVVGGATALLWLDALGAGPPSPRAPP